MAFPWIDDGEDRSKSATVCGCVWGTLLEKMKSGEMLGVATHKQRVVYRTLVQRRGVVSTDAARKAFTLQNSEAYIHYSETAPAHRGNGLHTAMLGLILARLATAGYRKVYIAGTDKNPAAVKAVIKAGFRCQSSERALVMLWGHIRFPLSLRVSKVVSPTLPGTTLGSALGLIQMQAPQAEFRQTLH